jgi:hypothetical protein
MGKLSLSILWFGAALAVIALPSMRGEVIISTVAECVNHNIAAQVVSWVGDLAQQQS